MEIPLVKKKAWTNDIINRQANIEGKKETIMEARPSTKTTEV